MTDLAMRRYEISSEKKFWQYEIKGGELLVEWGKIGGAGKQRSHKTFATEDVAKSEVAKLVAKKEKEGFVEVGAAAAPTPPPTPTPAPVAASASPTIAPRIVWNAETAGDAANYGPARDVEGNERSWLVTIREHFETKNWEGNTLIGRLKNGLSKAPTAESRAWAERVLAKYAVGAAPKDLDVDGDAALLALYGPVEEIATLLSSRGGLLHLVKVLIASLGIVSRDEERKADAYAVFDRASIGHIHSGGTQWRLAKYVRAYMMKATDDERTKARAELEKLRSGKLGPRILAAFASNDPTWANEVANEFFASNKDEVSYDTASQLFDFVRDPALVTKLAKRHPQAVSANELIHDMGLDAEPAVIAHHDKDPSSQYATASLAMIESVGAAKQMAHSLGKKRATDTAKAYFERRPDLAVAVLEPIIKTDAKLAPYAKPVLDAILRAHPELGGAVAKKPKAKVATSVPAVLAQAPRLKKSVTLPDWTKSLPQVLLRDGTALPDVAIQNLVLMLHESAVDALAQVKKVCDEKSLAAFAWDLFEAWLGASGSSKEGWAFTALGHLGGDEEARRLAPLVRAWPGESQHARAVTGLSVLGAIGTDVALMHLHGIAQKVKFKGLQEKARAKMDELAKARGLTADELADRLVPDLGLDETGSLSLDFGSRKFTVGFDEELKPFVLDGSGKKIGELPRPNKSDDATVAGESVERWKTLKKDAKTVASTQIVRLENAMCAQRRWTADDYRAFIVDHPLVVHLARRLVWGIFDGAKLGTTFRVAEDRTLVSADDVEVKLPKDAIIGLVHRLDMDEKTLAAWGDHLGNYQILQPFDQLGRALHSIEAAEKKSETLARTKGVKVKTGKVLGLEVRGWRKGPPQDAGWVWEMNKTIGKLELTLPLGGGLCMGWHEGTPSEQELGAVSIAGRDGSKANFGMLSPVVFSEIVRELEMLRDA